LKEQLKYPDMEAAAKLFEKLGIEPSSRFAEHEQDFEYTSCKLEEIEQYLALYLQPDTSPKEKRVLGCFFFECLNEYVVIHKKSHSLFSKIMAVVYDDIGIHKSELAYWMNTEDPNEDNWWPITRYLLMSLKT
jgi:hypothetical protein